MNDQTKPQHKYVFLHGPDMVKDAAGKDIILHIRVAKNDDNLDLFGYKLTKVDESADAEHWTWEFAAPAIKAGGDHHAGTGYAESNKKKYEAAVEARIKSIEDNIKLMSNEFILLRGPRTDDAGTPIPIEVKMVKRNEHLDLSEYSLLRRSEKYDEWVPTAELELYQRALDMRNRSTYSGNDV